MGALCIRHTDIVRGWDGDNSGPKWRPDTDLLARVKCKAFVLYFVQSLGELTWETKPKQSIS